MEKVLLNCGCIVSRKKSSFCDYLDKTFKYCPSHDILQVNGQIRDRFYLNREDRNKLMKYLTKEYCLDYEIAIELTESNDYKNNYIKILRRCD